MITLAQIESVYHDGKGMEEFARGIEAIVRAECGAELLEAQQLLERCHQSANDVTGKLLAAQARVVELERQVKP